MRVCPRCKGYNGDCHFCSGTGWVSELEVPTKEQYVSPRQPTNREVAIEDILKQPRFGLGPRRKLRAQKPKDSKKIENARLQLKTNKQGSPKNSERTTKSLIDKMKFLNSRVKLSELRLLASRSKRDVEIARILNLIIQSSEFQLEPAEVSAVQRKIFSDQRTVKAAAHSNRSAQAKVHDFIPESRQYNYLVLCVGGGSWLEALKSYYSKFEKLDSIFVFGNKAAFKYLLNKFPNKVFEITRRQNLALFDESLIIYL